MDVRVIAIRTGGKLVNQAMLNAGIRRAVRDTVAEGTRYMAEYPPSQPGQRYKRTGTLKRSWSMELRRSDNITEGIVGSNSNIAPYNRDVQGTESDQQPYFRGLWQNVDDLVTKFEGELPLRVQNEIDRAAS